MACVGQESAASFSQPILSNFDLFVTALSPFISKVSGQISGQRPQPIHFSLSTLTLGILFFNNRYLNTFGRISK